MARLICYTPFPRMDSNEGDLRENVKQLEDLNGRALPSTANGTPISSSIVIYKGEERSVSAGDSDVVFVYGHGSNVDTDVGDNLGNELTQVQLLKNLKAMNADKAKEVHFFICFSAFPNHIGSTFKKKYSGIKVYATSEEARGGLVVATRRGTPRTAAWAPGRLKEISS